MIKRKAPSGVKKLSLAEQAASLGSIINSIDNHIASMDNERVKLDSTKQELEVTHVSSIKEDIKLAHQACDGLSAAYKADMTGECFTARKHACDAIKLLQTDVETHNSLVVGFNTDYNVLAAHVSFEATKDVVGMLDAADVTFLDCK